MRIRFLVQCLLSLRTVLQGGLASPVPLELQGGDAISRVPRSSEKHWASPHPRPKVVERFTADVVVSSTWLFCEHTRGRIYYDGPGRTYKLEHVNYTRRIFDDAQINWTEQINDTCFSDHINEACNIRCDDDISHQSKGFSHFLEVFTSVGVYVGKDKVLGRDCDQWMANTTSVWGMNVTATLCIDGDEPLRLRSMPGSPLEEITFHNLSRSISTANFTLPEVCTTLAPPCGDATIKSQRIYLAHPTDRFNVSSQDVADAKGDVVFLCYDQLPMKWGKYELLSEYELSIVNRFTSYRNFPPAGPGFGGDNFHVGRVGPLYTGVHLGQCEDDAHLLQRIGQWFSLPHNGQCVDRRQQLGKDCTWRIERRIATVQISCILETHGLQEMCPDSKAPFAEETQLLLRALRSENVSEGGCERFRQTECHSHTGCAHLTGDCCPALDGTMLPCCNITSDMRVAVQNPSKDSHSSILV